MNSNRAALESNILTDLKNVMSSTVISASNSIPVIFH